MNVSPRSVCIASRVLKSADEQVIAAVESGDVAVSDAAAIADRPKDEQRQAIEAKREGRARTLRQAAEELDDDSSGLEASCGVGVSPASEQAGGTPGPQSSRRVLRSEANRFARELDKLYRRVDVLTVACGGANEHTDYLRDCLRIVIDAFRDFVHHFLPAER